MAEGLVGQSDTAPAWEALAEAALCAGVLDRAQEALASLERVGAPATSLDSVRARIDRANARASAIPAQARPLAPGEFEARPAPSFGDPSRNFLNGVNFRGRYLFVPDSIMDIWFFDHRSEGSGVPERPPASAYALGLEYVLDAGQNAGIFYAEYLKPNFDAGYWDDREEPPDYADGNYIVPKDFGLVVLGADYAAQFRFNSWFGLNVGAGLGVGIVTGSLEQWQPGEPEDAAAPNNLDADCGRMDPAFVRATSCGSDGELAVPGALPFIDVNFGPKFYFSDKAVLRVEGGLHNLPYVGTSFGATF
jgi:hypothetical protein